MPVLLTSTRNIQQQLQPFYSHCTYNLCWPAPDDFVRVTFTTLLRLLPGNQPVHLD